MAQYSEANTKTAVAAAAVQLTLILKDTVKSEVTPKLQSPHHPIRQIEKLFDFNPKTGVVTSDDTYITAAYDGLFPSKGNEFQRAASQVVVLSTATVEDAGETNIILTFDDIMLSAEGVSVAGTGYPARNVTAVTFASNVVTVTVDTAYEGSETITVSGRFFGNKNQYIDLSTESVTNNVTDSTVPYVVSMTVEDAAPTDIVMVLSEPVTGTNLGVTIAGTTSVAPASVAGSTTNTLTWTLAVAVANGESPTLAYNDAVGDVADTVTANALATFGATAVTNNVAA